MRSALSPQRFGQVVEIHVIDVTLRVGGAAAAPAG
jgi:hypothetical protein